MIPSIIKSEYSKLPPNLRVLFIGLVVASVMFGFLYLFPEHKAGETAELIIDSETGAQVCRSIVGCDIYYNSTTNSCYFREDC